MDDIPVLGTPAGRSRPRGRRTAGLALLLLATAPAAAAGQAAPPVDSLKVEIEALKARLDSLEAAVAAGARTPAPGDRTVVDPLERLRAAARAAAAEPDTIRSDALPDADATSQEFVGRESSLQALNPEISVTGDVFGRVGRDESGVDNFYDREFEFAFQSNLDPYSRAKIFVSHHVPGGEIEPFGEAHGEEEGEGHAEGGEFGVEEAYVQWVNLPGGFGVKLGRVFQQFGTLNRWHSHALAFQSRSLPHLAFIGEENLAQTGASLYWLLPVHGLGTWEVTAEATRNRNELLFGESEGVSVLGHLNGFFQLTGSVDLDLGLSGITGRFESEEGSFDRRLYGIEGALTWAPPGRSKYRGATLRGGVMFNDRGDDVASGTEGEVARGLWAWGDVQLARSWYLGGRYEWVENPDDPSETAWLAGPSLTWWQSEWVRVRAEYDHLDGPEGSSGQFLLQVTFAMGPHKHETY